MYLPRELISLLYSNLVRTHHRLSPPVLILAALETDVLCACRILTALFKRDYISHKIQPVSGYSDLSRAANELVQPMKTSVGGSGGVIVCLGVGGLIDLRELLGLDTTDQSQDGLDGIEVWVLDSRRPWNLENVFGGQSMPPVLSATDGNAGKRARGIDKGRLQKSYKPGAGGIIVFDDGDISEELIAEGDAYCALAEMPEVDDQDHDSEDDTDDLLNSSKSKKRKSWAVEEEGYENQAIDGPPRQKRRSNSGSSISNVSERHGSTSSSRSQSPAISPNTNSQSARRLRQQLLKLRRTHESTLESYFQLGLSYSEPISSLMYSLASDLGREDNDLLWLTIVGVSSLELSGQTSTGLSMPNHKNRSNQQLSFSHHQSWHTTRSSRLYALLRDEVRRLNLLSTSHDLTASSPSDNSIRLTPDPRFILLRHWSLYDSMLHSPYLASRLHIWNDSGVKRLHKLLAKMGVSLSQCRQSYTHMDISLKRNLRENLLKYAAIYGLDELVPDASGTAGASDYEGWGFVRSWGWKAQLSAVDVGVIVNAILQVGHSSTTTTKLQVPSTRYISTTSSMSRVPQSELSNTDEHIQDRSASLLPRFFAAYDALSPSQPSKIIEAIPLAQHLLRAILRTGASLLAKRQIRHLRAFRMGVVKDGPDLGLFAGSPAALVNLALWVGEGLAGSERGGRKGDSPAGAEAPLVLAALDEVRGTYILVGTGGGVGRSSGGAVMANRKERDKEKVERKAEKQRLRVQRQELREKKKADRAVQKAAASCRDLTDGNDNSDDEAGGIEEEAEEDETEDNDSDSDLDSSSDSDSGDEQRTRQHKRGAGRNRFGLAFTEVVEETNARVKIDSFDHCVVEVKKEDLGAFLEGLSLKAVVGR